MPHADRNGLRLLVNGLSRQRDRDVRETLLPQNLGHHPLVLVVQEMTMEDGHIFDDGISEVQNRVSGTATRDVHRVQPCRMGEARRFLGMLGKEPGVM